MRRGVQELRDARRQPLFVETVADRADPAGIDRRVEHMRALGDDPGQARRAAEEIAEQFAHRRVGAQDRQQLHRARHTRQRRVERAQRRVGVARAGKGGEQRRHEFGQHFARAGAAHRRAAAEMPAANGLGRLFRAPEAEAAQRRQGLGIVDDAGEHQAARLGAERRRVLEQARVVPLDPAQMIGHRRRERLEPGVAAEGGEARQRVGLERQALGLLVVDHLQAMLDAAQERIGVGQIVDRLGADPMLDVQLPEHVERSRAAHRRPPAAENQLLRLDEEFDLADAAAAELDVVAGDRDRARGRAPRGSGASSRECRRSPRSRNTCAR